MDYKNGIIARCLWLLLIVSPAVQAQDLMTTYQQAVAHDPEFLAAAAARDAALTAKPQARAGLLPNANLSADVAYERFDSNTSGKSDFNSHSYTLSVTQPVFRYEAYVQLRQADATIAQAEAEYSAAAQELMVRVAQRYFDVLAAQDTLEFARREKTAISRQLEQANKRFEVGLIAITDVHEAQAAYDLTIAQEIAAQNALANALEALRETTGQWPEDLQPLQNDVPLTAPQPEDMAQWTKVALDQNLSLKASEHAQENARHEIKRRKAGHYPTVDLTAQHNDSDIGGGLFGNRETETDSIALVLNVPLYTGGLVSARTREAAHLYQRAKFVTEQTRRAVLRQTRDAYRGVLTGISRVKALEQATVSSESALKTTEAGFEVGTRTIVDVLVSQRELFRARRDYKQSRYEYILNSLRLKQAAGTLSPEDLAQVNQWLAR